MFLNYIIFAETIVFSLGLTYYYEWVYNTNTLAPDNYLRSVITVNGQFPGPTVRATVGDFVTINVKNLINNLDGIAVHWHGITQRGTPYSDGTAYITNCPISYGNTYNYTFNLSEAGTFWYHLHSSVSRADGGYGFLIADEITPIATYNSEILIILSDWYHQNGDYIDAGLQMFGPTVAATNTTPQSGFQWPGNGQSILVNGLGNRTVYIDVEANQIYRVRLLNAAALAYYNFAIASHNLTVILEETQQLEPTILESIDIDSGQRFDFLISTYNKSILNYQITIESNWRGNDTTKAGIFSTVYLHYQGATKNSTTKPVSQSKNWNTQINQLKPLTSTLRTIPNATKEFFFDMRQQYVNASSNIGLDYIGKNKKGYLRWTVNNLSYEFPSIPLLLGSYYNIVNDQTYPNPSLPININLNETVQIVIQNHVALNGRCEQHPWHLHGTSFWVLGTGEGEYIPSIHSSQLNTYNPVYVDTVVNYPTSNGARRNYVVPLNTSDVGEPCGWAVIRFVADNPGMWIFHCHIDWHLVLGMAVVFNIQSETLWDDITLPYDYTVCGISTSVYDTVSNENNCPSTSSDNVVISKSSLTLAFVFTIFGTIILGFGILIYFKIIKINNKFLFNDVDVKRNNEIEFQSTSTTINPTVNPMIEPTVLSSDNNEDNETLETIS